MNPAILLRRDLLFRSGPRRGVQSVASATVGGADLDATTAITETA
jgi:hypothetical protein